MFAMDGVIDLHVHAGPDVLGRVGDDVEIAFDCRAAGMAGIAVKAHLESTASRAYHTNRVVSGFRYIGGICLNYPVGGINPAAVDACLRLGGRVVWMPSGHARFHAQVTGSLGNWGYSDMSIYNPADGQGITVLDEQGALTPHTREVIALVREHDAVIATSHLSPQEIIAVAEAGRDKAVKVVVTHIRWTLAYDLELAKRAIDLGAVVEIAGSTVGGYTNRFPIGEVVSAVNEFGAQNLIIASDAGGIRHPRPHEALRVLATNLAELGVRERDLDLMLKENPARLVGD